MFSGLLVFCLTFLVGIFIVYSLMRKNSNKSDWRIILPAVYGVLSFIVMATIYPDREVAQMEFGFIGIGFLSLPFSALMPIFRNYFFGPVFEFFGFDYCSVKVFSIGFSLMTLGCIQYYLVGMAVQRFVKKSRT